MVALYQVALFLTSLRTALEDNNLQAYIIPAQDEHYTEFVAKCHQRRAFISGFTGSAGTAIVTLDEALLWTDGRYYLQAENELNPDLWTLMKDGIMIINNYYYGQEVKSLNYFPADFDEPRGTLGVPSQSEYLVANLTANSRVGVDPTLYTKGQWDSMESALKAKNITLVGIADNLIDPIWGEGRPACGSKPVFHLEYQYSGKNTSDKIAEIRTEMASEGADLLIVTELDEVAWLLNLRGNDIDTTSLFFSYVIISPIDVYVFMNETRLEPAARTYIMGEGVTDIYSYDSIVQNATSLINSATQKIWVNRNTNYALVSLVDPSRLLVKLTPIALRKAIKNEVEVEGYRKALIRDAAALCEFLAWLEDTINNDTSITEIQAATKLRQIRENRSDIFIDLSFTTISASGSNAAVIHYMPTDATDTPLSKSDIFLLDSGAIYKDGTTDITRTLHFGTPTEAEKEAYTRVLKGQINLVTAHFPYKTVGHRLDSFARQALWDVGLEYNHGTGHGIGHALNVHEGPFSIGSRFSDNDPGLEPYMFTSNEPGYYQDGDFGIRLENIIMVVNATLPHNFQNRGFLGFEDLTYLPYQHKLIDFNILTGEEVQYLNDYQRKIREIVGKYIQDSGMPQAAYDWLIKETPNIGETTETPTSTSTPTTTPTDSGKDSVRSGYVATLVGLLVSFVMFLQ